MSLDMSFNRFARRRFALALALVLGAGVAVAGCAKSTPDFQANAIVPGSPEDFAQNVGDRVFFESDSSDLTAKAQDTLNRQAAWLQQYDRGPFTIEGHADERGTREYNFALGARRAEASKQYLVGRGVAASRIRTTSFGKERPVAVCNDISCWSQNRRAVTAVGQSQS